MTEALREAAQYRKGKTPLVDKYLSDHKKLFDEIAGRGFLNLPGYASDAENQLEVALKMGLSELNYKILSETIERELKQTGIDYNNAYILAAMSWELEKQTLMSAWDQELAGIKQGMAAEEEIKARLALEVNARQIVLIEAKTAIDVEMEGYRTQLAAIDAATAPYEVCLANAKLLTAQKKLEILPVLQVIITKEQELLALETSKAGEYGELMSAERELAIKKQRLVPGLSQLATEKMRHATMIPTQIATERLIANEKILQADAETQKSGNIIQELNTDIINEGKKILLSAAERGLKTIKLDNAAEIINKEKGFEDALITASDVSLSKIITADNLTQISLNADKDAINTTENSEKLGSANVLIPAEIAADSNAAAAEVYERGQVADINAAAHITAQLTHLIG